MDDSGMEEHQKREETEVLLTQGGRSCISVTDNESVFE